MGDVHWHKTRSIASALPGAPDVSLYRNNWPGRRKSLSANGPVPVGKKALLQTDPGS